MALSYMPQIPSLVDINGSKTTAQQDQSRLRR